MPTDEEKARADRFEAERDRMLAENEARRRRPKAAVVLGTVIALALVGMTLATIIGLWWRFVAVPLFGL